MFSTFRFSAWGYQYLAILLSLACFAALVVLLSHFDQKPVFTWQGVTLNTIISILSVAIKAALAYVASECLAQWKWILLWREERPLIDFDRIDNATRGPLGSLRVLLWTKGALAVQFGAILTILAVALDPLAQQLIQFRQETVFVGSSQWDASQVALNSRTITYEMGTVMPTELHPVNATKFNHFATTSIPLSMEAAILNGLSRSPKEVGQEALFQCSTSNCTWNQFTTLGICNRCNDLTADLKRVEGFGDALVAISGTSFASYVIPSTAFTLPNGHFIANIDGCAPYNGAYATCTPTQNLGIYSDEKYSITSFGTGNPNKTVSMKDIDTLLWSMSVIYPDIEELNKTAFDPGQSSTSLKKIPERRWPEIPMKATECALYYCVKNVDSSVKENVLVENITEATEARRRPDSWERYEEDSDASPESLMPPELISSLEFHTNYSAVGNTELMLEFPNNQSQPFFRIYDKSVKSLSAHMQKLFLANLTGNTRIRGEIEKKLGKGAVGFNGGSYGPFEDQLRMKATPPALNGVWSWQNHNVSRMFYTLATSMTNEMRRNFDPEKLQSSTTDRDGIEQGSMGTLQFNGKVGISTVIYEIQWPWIALHAFLLLSVVAFLSITLLNSKTGEDGVPLWKGSTLAVLKHGRAIGTVLDRSNIVGDMEDRARKSYVRVPKEDGDENAVWINMTEQDRERDT